MSFKFFFSLSVGIFASPVFAEFAVSCYASQAQLNEALTKGVVSIQREKDGEIRYQKFVVSTVKSITSRPAFQIPNGNSFGQEYCALLEGHYGPSPTDSK